MRRACGINGDQIKLAIEIEAVNVYRMRQHVRRVGVDLEDWNFVGEGPRRHWRGDDIHFEPQSRRPGMRPKPRDSQHDQNQDQTNDDYSKALQQPLHDLLLKVGNELPKRGGYCMVVDVSAPAERGLAHYVSALGIDLIDNPYFARAAIRILILAQILLGHFVYVGIGALFRAAHNASTNRKMTVRVV